MKQSNMIINPNKESEEKIELRQNFMKSVCRNEMLENDSSVIADELIGGMQIFAKTMGGKTVAFQVERSDKIIDIKKKIQEKIGLHRDDQKLIYQNVILDDDDKTIDEYQIRDQSLINIVARLRMEIELSAKTMDGKNVSFKVEKSVKIIDIKYKIQEKIGLNIDEQKLIYKDEILNDDDKTIDEYQICDQSVITVVDRLRSHEIFLFAKPIEGINNAIFINKSFKIIDIKNKIEKKWGLVISDQLLNNHHELLDNDDKTLEQYQIDEKSIINITVDTANKIQLFFQNNNDGNIIPFYVIKTLKIIDLKNKIREKFKCLPDGHTLFYQDKILEDCKTINEYQICEKSVIDIDLENRFRKFVKELLNNKKKLFIKFMDKKSFSISAKETDKIQSIKWQINFQTGLHPDEQKLVYNGVVLEDEKTVKDYQISTQSTLEVVKMMEIFARTLNGEIFSIYLVGTENIRYVKCQIQEKIKLNRKVQVLFYQGTLLDDEDATVNQYGISEISIIDIFVRSEDEIQILIRKLDKSIIPINIIKSSNIFNLKLKIEHKTKIQFDENILLHENIILDDEKSLKDYKIGDGSVLWIDNSPILLFIEAIKSGSLEKVRDLYDNKFRDGENKPFLPSPMHHACKQSNADIVKFLIENHFKIDLFDGEFNMSIHYACTNNCVKILETLIQHRCKLEVCDAYGMKPIHLACLNGNIQHVKLLIENHCDLESKDYLGRRPIHLACLAGNINIVKLLIQNKCEIDVFDKSNNSPLNIAEKEKFVDIMKILNEEIARRIDGRNPIHLACLDGSFQNFKSLIENVCDLESKDNFGMRSIHLACLAGNIDIVKLLIEKKCKIDVLDESNDSPFDIAEKGNFIDIIDILNEEISRRMIENMITELELKCDNNCDHKFCETSLRNKTFKNGIKIKQGSFGKVYHYKLSQGSRHIAIKKIPKNEINSKYIERNIKKFIDKINHERIIKYFGAMTKNENVFIFMEFMSGGSLKSKISTNPLMITNKVIHYTMQILEGLQFLHINKIIHRDIKPDNILLDGDDNVKLTDLGLGLSLCGSDGRTTPADTFCGTYYMAPEIINGEKYSYGADIWAVGVTVIEMATGKGPYHGTPLSNVMFKIATTKKISYQLPKSSPNEIINKFLIDQMLIQEPSGRPSATVLINILKKSNEKC